jgi:DNA helicase-2/ATP-dependent DNA helicase PcrA
MSKNNPSLQDFIHHQLNPEQRKAVLHKSGPILVIAGAGSGKTRVITARIAHLLIHAQILPSAIVALTFTNKAAQEMKERIAHFVGTYSALPFIGTFHSYCLRLLKQNSPLLENPFFSILDEDDQHKLIHALLQRNNLHKQISARQAAYHISHTKNHLTNAKENLMHPLMQDIFRLYEEEKKASKCLDFDDLLLEVLTLFSKQRTFKKQFQEEVKHILVDEYQDTNVVQHELLKHMAKSNKEIVSESICAVGDEDQSIYSWRGATIANMLNFQKDFPNTTLIKVEQNYRSVQPILSAANHIIQHNRKRNPKNLWSARAAHNRIRILTCLSEYQESDVIMQGVQLIAQKQKLNTIALLYRTHAQSRPLEEACIKRGIPYRIIGGIQFYERKEIKDLLAYLRLVINPFDRTSLFRIFNTPARGLGSKVEEQWYSIWQREPFLTFALCAQKLLGDLPKTKQKAVEDFLKTFDDIEPTTAPSIALDFIVKRTCYISYLKEAYEPHDADARIQNIKELFDAMKYFESNKQNSTLEQFLEDVALMQEKIYAQGNTQDALLLMTLHAAKGLEFDTVIITGLEESILPTARALQDDDALEEERRLLYVGITRAKEHLLLSHAKYRYTYGTMTHQIPSRFLRELPTDLTQREDCSYWTSVQLQSFFSHWFKQTELAKEQKSESCMPSISFNPHPNKKVTEAFPRLFKKNQPVKHAMYGMGIVQNIETKRDGTVHVTVKFKDVIKKIVDKFLQAI